MFKRSGSNIRTSSMESTSAQNSTQNLSTSTDRQVNSTKGVLTVVR